MLEPIILVASLLFVLLLLWLLYTTGAHLRASTQQNKELTQLLFTQRNQCDAMATYVADMRRLKHDYKNMSLGLYQLLELGDIAKAKSYLTALDSRFAAAAGDYKTYSNHPFVQAILRDTAAAAQAAGIRFEAMAQISEDLTLPDLDLCRLLSNVCTNALEACQRIPATPEATASTSPYIKISGGAKSKWQLLTVENSYNGQLRTDDKTGEILSAKGDDPAHGLGLKNIRQIAESYGGLISIEPNTQEKRFTVSLHLPLDKK